MTKSSPHHQRASSLQTPKEKGMCIREGSALVLQEEQQQRMSTNAPKLILHLRLLDFGQHVS